MTNRVIYHGPFRTTTPDMLSQCFLKRQKTREEQNKNLPRPKAQLKPRGTNTQLNGENPLDNLSGHQERPQKRFVHVQSNMDVDMKPDYSHQERTKKMFEVVVQHPQREYRFKKHQERDSSFNRVMPGSSSQNNSQIITSSNNYRMGSNKIWNLMTDRVDINCRADYKLYTPLL